MEDLDGQHHRIIVEPQSKIAKAIATLPIERTVMWRRDSNGYPVIKDIVSAANRDAIILHSRGSELAENDACIRCVSDMGPFLGCVADQNSSPPMGYGACSNCIWGAHPDRCSLSKFN